MNHDTLRRAATLVISLAALSACDSGSTAPRAGSAMPARAYDTTPSGNTIYRDAETVPFSFVVYSSCANGGQGEVLQVSGAMQYAGHWITNRDGQRVHYQTVSRFTGSAVGWESGEAYDVATRELSQGNTDYGRDGIVDSGEELQRIALTLTSQATGAVTDIVLVGRFVQAATGEFVLDGWEASARCR